MEATDEQHLTHRRLARSDEIRTYESRSSHVKHSGYETFVAQEVENGKLKSHLVAWRSLCSVDGLLHQFSSFN